LEGPTSLLEILVLSMDDHAGKKQELDCEGCPEGARETPRCPRSISPEISNLSILEFDPKFGFKSISVDEVLGDGFTKRKYEGFWSSSLSSHVGDLYILVQNLLTCVYFRVVSHHLLYSICT
jgi:hypothetical protein